MVNHLSRRDLFLAGSAVTVGNLLGLAACPASIDPVKRNGKSKIKLSCAAYSFRDQLTGKKEPHWTLDDFIDFCAAQNLDGTELTGYYFPKQVTTEYLAHVKQRSFLLGLDV